MEQRGVEGREPREVVDGDALVAAVRGGFARLVNLLARAGADKAAALDIARDERDFDLIKLLQGDGADADAEAGGVEAAPRVV